MHNCGRRVMHPGGPRFGDPSANTALFSLFVTLNCATDIIHEQAQSTKSSKQRKYLRYLTNHILLWFSGFVDTAWWSLSMETCCVINKLWCVVCFLLDDSPASEIYMPTFRSTLFHITLQHCPQRSSFYTHLPAYEDGTDSVPKCRHTKFRRRGIAQKKAYNVQYTVKVWNQNYDVFC